jgi:hypothetical protein
VIAETEAPARVNLWAIYAPSLAVTVLAWAAVAFAAGPATLLTAIILTLLEVTFSFDNAVVNSKLIQRLSPGWQKAFMTVGIVIAVFVVRFALPIFIVQLAAGLSFGGVVDLAVHQPAVYAQHLASAGPMIDAFGGTFLLMIGVGYFLDTEKDIHWIGWLESRLAPLGRFDNITIFVMISVAVIAFFTVDAAERTAVLAAAIIGVLLHIGLDLFGAVFDSEDSDEPGRGKLTTLVGAAAAIMFVRLEVLDASFSFDGVIGAFAITTSVLVIMAGLGAGAMWVRSMTVHLVRTGTLAKYKYLEHGAHWAILFLGMVMLLKLYGVDLPEWLVGSLGIVFITAALVTSVIRQRPSIAPTVPTSAGNEIAL